LANAVEKAETRCFELEKKVDKFKDYYKLVKSSVAMECLVYFKFIIFFILFNCLVLLKAIQNFYVQDSCHSLQKKNLKF